MEGKDNRGLVKRTGQGRVCTAEGKACTERWGLAGGKEREVGPL